MPEDRLDALIDDLYGLAADGGSSESGWEALLARVALLMGATSAALQLASPQQGTTRLLATHNVADAVNQDYAAHFFPRDIFMDQARAMPGQLMLSQDHLPDALVAQSEIYNDLFRHHLHGAFYVAGGVTPVGDGRCWASACSAPGSAAPSRPRKAAPCSASGRICAAPPRCSCGSSRPRSRSAWASRRWTA
ncbi:hypothetical protein [Teichococcus aestuarii]|uniref:hypothetical protein n=1 Tax=Teichococcus aestuarii TaxID=568898 RepID=UPI00361A1FA0